MKLILTIAWRNLIRHRGKSLVIGAVLFLGAFLMTLGNGVISGMGEGIRKNIVDGFMGDIVLISDKQKTENILFNLMGSSIEPIHSYKEIKPVLARQSFVDKFLPVGKNGALVLSENEATPGFAFLIGADLAAYQKMFPGNFEILEGKGLGPDRKGLWAPTHSREQLYDALNFWLIPEGGAVIKENLSQEASENFSALIPSSTVVMMGMAGGMNSTSDIRFTVKGIIKYKALHRIFGHFCLTDIESYRECLGYFSSGDDPGLPPEKKSLLSLEGKEIENLFESDALLVSNARRSVSTHGPTTAADAGAHRESDMEFGAYNAVFVRLKKGFSRVEALDRLNAALRQAKTGVRAVTWNRASGPIGSMAVIIKSALFLFVTLLFFVAVIIIVNTLTMAALERASELGMMRAVGARKSFIGGMFLGETFILSILFGGLGIAAGVVAVKVIPLLKITSANDIVQILYGGNIFHPLLGLPDVALTLLQLAMVALFASLYPMSVARNIAPLDAVSRE